MASLVDDGIVESLQPTHLPLDSLNACTDKLLVISIRISLWGKRGSIESSSTIDEQINLSIELIAGDADDAECMPDGFPPVSSP